VSLKNIVSLMMIMLLFVGHSQNSARADHDIPIIPLNELAETLTDWEDSYVSLRGFLHRGSHPIMTADPFALLAMSAPSEVFVVHVIDKAAFLQWNPWEQTHVVFADLTGILRLGADGKSASLEMKKSPKLYYPVLYPYPRPPEELFPRRQTDRGSADYLVIAGSQGHPVPEWMEHELITHWEMGLFFNTSSQHLKIFYGEGSLPLGSRDPRSIRQRKIQMKPYLMQGSAKELFSYLESLETRMKEHVEKEEQTTLTMIISGCHQQLDEVFELENLAGALKKISQLGALRIVLHTSYAGSWAETLLQLENISLIVSSEEDQKSYAHQHGIALQLSRYLLSGKAGRKLGEIVWSELLEQLNPPFGGEGAQWEEKLVYTLLSSEESRYRIRHQQSYLDPDAHEFSLCEYRYEIMLREHHEELEAKAPGSARIWKSAPAFYSSATSDRSP
jgi:hypothetical protein